MATSEQHKRWRENNPGYDAAYQRRYRAANPERSAEYQRAWRIANPDRIALYADRYKARKVHVRRAHLLRTNYSLTPEQYEGMLASQSGVCAICRKPETKLHHGKVVWLAVDHDHKTGVIRGLLCSRCNTVIGLLDESRTLVAAVADYLDAHAPSTERRSATTAKAMR